MVSRTPDTMLSSEVEAQRLSVLVTSLPDAVLVEDATRHIVLVNEAFCVLFAPGAKPEHLLGADCAAAATQSSQLFVDPPGFIQRVDAILAARKRVMSEVLQMADGRTVERDFMPVDTGGEDLGLMWLYRDVTQARRTVSALVYARDAAEEANRAKSDFLATMSHEIRTPLNAVLGMTELAMDTEDPRLRQDLLSGVLTNARALLARVEDILDLSSIESGDWSPVEESFDPAALLADVAASFRPRVVGKPVELRAVALNVPAGCIGDPGRIRQVLTNLVHNAVRFVASGHIELRAEPSVSAGDVTGLMLTVSDTGPGIESDEIAHVFERFRQGRLGRAQRTGSGLGLAICKEIIDRLGGTIHVDSEPGVGTTFRIFVPVWWTDQAPRAVEPQPKTFANSKNPRRVLVMDDTDDARFYVAEALTRAGHKVFQAASGPEALDLLRLEPVDLVLADVEMPGMDGLAFTRALRVMERFTGATPTRVVALTAHALAEWRDRCRDAGMDGFLAKPIARAELLKQVDALAAAEPMFEVDDQVNKAFLGRVVEAMTEARANLAAGDLEEVRRAGHRLKGTGGMFGHDELTRLGAGLEVAAKASDVAAAATAIHAILAEIQRVNRTAGR